MGKSHSKHTAYRRRQPPEGESSSGAAVTSSSSPISTSAAIVVSQESRDVGDEPEAEKRKLRHRPAVDRIQLIAHVNGNTDISGVVTLNDWSKVSPSDGVQQTSPDTQADANDRLMVTSLTSGNTDQQEWSFILQDCDGDRSINSQDVTCLLSRLYAALSSSSSSHRQIVRLHLTVSSSSDSAGQPGGVDAAASAGQTQPHVSSGDVDESPWVVRHDAAMNENTAGGKQPSRSLTVAGNEGDDELLDERHLAELIRHNMNWNAGASRNKSRRQCTSTPVRHLPDDSRHHHHLPADARRSFGVGCQGNERRSGIAPPADDVRHTSKNCCRRISPPPTNRQRSSVGGRQRSTSPVAERDRFPPPPGACSDPERPAADGVCRWKEMETVSASHYYRRHRHRARNQSRAMRQVAEWVERQAHQVVAAPTRGGDPGVDGPLVRRHEHHHVHEHYHDHYHYHYHVVDKT